MPRLFLGLVVALAGALLADRLAPRWPGPKPARPLEAVRVGAPGSARGLDPVATPGGAAIAGRPIGDRSARLETRRRLARSGPGTYIDSLFTTADSLVRRWPELGGGALEVAVILPRGVGGRAVELDRAVRIALDRWQQLPLGIRFATGADTARADIVVRSIQRFEIDRAGQATIEHGRDGVIRRAVATLALEAPDGRPLSEVELAMVATHELGHALGLPHSDRPSDVMYPTAQVNGVSARDRATAQLLYSLAPGPSAQPRPR
jgi:hypothetical protein